MRTSVRLTASRVVKLTIAVLFRVYDPLRAMVARAAGRSPRSPFVVLMYHSVKQHERELFARQMDEVLAAGEPVDPDFIPRNTDTRPHIAVTFDDGYSSIIDNALPILRERHIPATVFVPSGHLGKSPGWISDSSHPNADERVLTREQLVQIQSKGVRIGSHGASHRSLGELSGPDVERELVQSRETLEKILRRDVNLFAFPYGSTNEEAVRLASQAGYTRVFLNVPVRRHERASGYVTGRVDVSPSDWKLEYQLKIRGAYEWLPWGIAAKRHLMTAIRRLSVTPHLRRARRKAPLTSSRVPSRAAR